MKLFLCLIYDKVSNVYIFICISISKEGEFSNLRIHLIYKLLTNNTGLLNGIISEQTLGVFQVDGQNSHESEVL